jgi:hypothetical protein
MSQPKYTIPGKYISQSNRPTYLIIKSEYAHDLVVRLLLLGHKTTLKGGEPYDKQHRGNIIFAPNTGPGDGCSFHLDEQCSNGQWILTTQGIEALEGEGL